MTAVPSRRRIPSARPLCMRFSLSISGHPPDSIRIPASTFLRERQSEGERERERAREREREREREIKERIETVYERAVAAV
jgi:hypothetical protein